LNGSAWQYGSGFYVYDGALVTLSGLNTIDFYVVGNGATDGFGLRNVSFTVEPSGVSEPATMLLLGFGLAGLAGVRRFR
jgi:hypothetical protein